MEKSKTSLYLSRILSGYFVFEYSGRTLRIKYPSTKIKYQAELIAQEELEKNRFEPWLRDEDTLNFLFSQGIWKPEYEDFIQKSEKQEEQLKIQLYKNFRQPKKTKEIRKALNTHRKKYASLFNLRHSFDYLTLEGYCEEVKSNYLLSQSIYDENENLCVFDKQRDIDEISRILARNTISSRDFRQIARSNEWAFYWNSNKIGKLFDAPVSEWTDEQRLLVSMSRMYDNARQHPDAPDEDVFEDDDAFDGWSAYEREKMKKEKSKSRSEKMLPGNLGKASEIFVAASSNEEAEDVMNLNDAQSLGIIRERNEFIMKQDKPVKECYLPDVQRDLIINSNNQMKSNVRKK